MHTILFIGLGTLGSAIWKVVLSTLNICKWIHELLTIFFLQFQAQEGESASYSRSKDTHSSPTKGVPRTTAKDNFPIVDLPQIPLPSTGGNVTGETWRKLLKISCGE